MSLMLACLLCFLVAQCSAQEMVRSTFSEEQRQNMLDAHNDLRRLQGAADMEQLKWNEKLAEVAQATADKCTGRPGNLRSNSLPYHSIGHSMWMSSFEPPSNYTEIVRTWLRTSLQVIWSSTTDLGCGYANCLSRIGHYVIYCYYTPGGNNAYRKPFSRGPPCSKCKSGHMWCNRGLCNSICRHEGDECQCAAKCKNCGVKDFRRCRCNCAAGWYGSDCSLRCIDRHKLCGANPGWPKRWCSKGSVRRRCAAMCGRCVPSDHPAKC